MSEDLEQQFQTWMEEHPKSWWGVPGPERPHFFFIAGVESQRARIAELEAERDRLLEVVTELARYAPDVPDWRNMAALLIPSSLVSYAVQLITPKEESRG